MRDAPAFHRNKQPMLEFLIGLFGNKSLNVLEIASGSGQHGPFFTEHLENLNWWPSDIDPEAIESVNYWREKLSATRVGKPQFVDVTAEPWRYGSHFPHWPTRFDAILSMNMIHIAPIEAMTGLLEGAGKRLGSGAMLIFYGPFKIDGKHIAPSNVDFDDYLRGQNVQWGVRDLEELAGHAQANGFIHTSTTHMPANNMVVLFTKS